METTPNEALLPIRVVGQVSTIDSVTVASGLGIQHKNLLETIRTHQVAIESNFGLIAFETESVKKDSAFQTRNLKEGKKTTKPFTIAHLTEDQALFIGTLSRNSRRVVDFKATLVKSFAEVRRQLREAAQPLYVQQQDQRIAKLERQLQLLIESRQQAARALLDLPRSTDPLPIETTRAKIQRLVNGYCRAKGVGQQEVWRRVYDRLYYLYRVSIRSYKRSERESWLDVAERNNHLDKIFAIVSAELTDTEH